MPRHRRRSSRNDPPSTIHHPRKARLALALILCIACAQTALAQPVPRLSDRAEASLLTILPGEGAADAFGHSALRVHDPARRLDRAYNYGTYRFGPYFIPKFVYGRLTYILSTAPSERLVRRYRHLERPVIEQKLRLSPAQVQRLFRFLEINARPENRAYRYDFLFDNCSTRPRDVLRRVLGDSLRYGLEALPRRTFRHLLDRYVANRAWIDFGFDLGLGLPTDRVARPREAMFLPEYLMEGFAGATVRTSTGREPLVTRTDTLFWVEGSRFAARPAFPWPAVLAWALFAAMLALTGGRLVQGRPPLRWPDVLFFGAVGLAGVVVWFLAFVSEHEVTRRNLNVVWALPTHLLLAGALALGWSGRFVRGYLLASGAAALVLALGWPLWPQDFHAAALPLVLTLALRCGWRMWTREKRPSRKHRSRADDAVSQFTA